MLAISPDGERVVVEEVQGKRLQFALWDGSRQIEEWHEVGHGAGKKEKGHLYTRDLGGQLLEQARFTRRGGRTAHASEDDDFDEWDGDDDRRGDDGWRHGPRKPKLNHVRFVMPDFLSSDSVVTNHRGRVLDRREFAPFGVPLAGNFKKMPFGYTGHRAEAQTSHWSTLHRHLDPRAGRWTQRDPAGFVDGPNMYGYVRSQPLVAVDSAGLELRFAGDLGMAAQALAELSRVPTIVPMLRRINTDKGKIVTLSIQPGESREVKKGGTVNGNTDFRTEREGSLDTQAELRAAYQAWAHSSEKCPGDRIIASSTVFAGNYNWSYSTRPPHRATQTEWVTTLVLHELLHVDGLTMYDPEPPGSRENHFQAQLLLYFERRH